MRLERDPRRGLRDNTQLEITGYPGRTFQDVGHY